MQPQPHQNFCYKTKTNAEDLKDLKIQYLHTTVVRGLFLAKKNRPDIQTGITYLSTRLKYTNYNYWQILRFIMRVQEIMKKNMK